ncbi:retrovirus-related pol polyprotein from transposon TNT 1-94 [Tanacetum coccineum]
MSPTSHFGRWFHTVAKMMDISNLNIQIKIKTAFLSLDIIYGVHLVFKFCDPRKFSSNLVYVNLKYKTGSETSHAYFAKQRDDEWLMIEMCQFLFQKENSVFEVSLESISRYYCGSGAIYVQGIEFQAIDNARLKLLFGHFWFTSFSCSRLPSSYHFLFLFFIQMKHEGIKKLKEVQQIQGSNLSTDQMQQWPTDLGETTIESENIVVGEKLFFLSEVNGKMHLMLSAEEVLHNSPELKLFHLKPSPESRFLNVMELLPRQVFRIKYKIDCEKLSSFTEYACYLVYKLSVTCHGLHCPVKVRDLLHRNKKETKIIYFRSPAPLNQHDASIPKHRKDGWMEVMVWKFDSKSKFGNNRIPMNLKLITYEGTMSGLTICGLDFRPIHSEIESDSQGVEFRAKKSFILKALDEGYSSKNCVRKFLRALHPKWRAKVTAIEESKDLTLLSLDELIGNLKVHEMIIKKDSEIVKAKGERKSLALKAKKVSSDDECLTSGSEDEEYTMAVRDFKKCGDPNHLIGECPKPPKDKNQRAFVGGSWSDNGEEDDEKIKDETCLICLEVDLEPDEWIKDSGCSKHMTGNRKLFSTNKAYNGGNVIFVSNLRGNIIGKGQICDNKCRVTFSEHDSEITKDGKIIGRGIRKKGLYVMKLGNKSKDKICLATIDENSTLWYRRLGRVNMHFIQSLASKELVRNLPKLKFDQHFCDACKIRKQAHVSHKAKNIVSTTRCLELLRMDLFGPSVVRSYRGNLYTLVIVDDYSRTDHGREFDNEVQFGEFCNANGKTPYELLRGRKPTLDYFRVFGSYSQNSKPTSSLINTRKLKNHSHVTFRLNSSHLLKKQSPLVDDDLDEEEAIKVTEKKNLENDIEDETLVIDEIVTSPKPKFFLFISTVEPKNMNEALTDESLTDESWIIAIQEELNQFVANDVWEIVPQPKNMTIIGTKWVFKNKLDENGVVSRNKARLVAQGYNQQEGIDYNETYATVARLESIRILLAYACALYFKLFQMDVKSAFLNGLINEEVNVAQPPGFTDFEKPDHVYKIKKALYGLKQILKAWYDRSKAFLIKHEYKIGMVENTLFTKKKSSNLIIVQIYVDDIIFGSTCQDMCDEYAKIMHDEFEMSMMGELNFFLGL